MPANEIVQELRSKHCGPCEGGVPPVERAEAERLLAALPGWKLSADAKAIRREWKMKHFMAGIAFFEKLAALAEEEGHHPDLHLSGYRNLAVDLTTHAISGLSENDFILAAKIDELPVEVKR